MKAIKSFAGLEKEITMRVHLALSQIAKDVFEDWYSMVKDRLYIDNMLKKDKNDTSGYWYKRSYDILNCIEIEWISPLECTIGYNTDKINAIWRERGLNSHMDIYGRDVSEYLPKWIEMGNKGGIVEYDGIGAFTVILNILRTSYSDQLKRACAKHGLNIE